MDFRLNDAADKAAACEIIQNIAEAETFWPVFDFFRELPSFT